MILQAEREISYKNIIFLPSMPLTQAMMALSHQPMRKDHAALPLLLSPRPQIKEWTAQDSCWLIYVYLYFQDISSLIFKGKMSAYDVITMSWLRAEHGVRTI